MRRIAAHVPRDAEPAAVAGVFVVATLVRMAGIGLPLIEWHGWRQTQTAYTALWLHENGFDLFHAQLPIFGPPFEAPMEFPLFQALAALVMDAGVTPDLAMRLTGLATFLLSAALLWMLARRFAGPVAALATLVVYLFVPLNLLFGKASLPEYLAIAGALGWLGAGLLWRERGTWAWFTVAFAAGTVGMLVKPTTPVFWSVPLVLATVPATRAGGLAWIRARLDPRLVALAVGPVGVAFAWTAYADQMKSAQLASAFLSSSSAFSRHFYYSDLAERSDPAIWARNWDWILQLVVGAGWLPFVLLGLFAAIRSSRRVLWIGVALSATLPVAVFFGGYFKHDYYWIALTPQAAIFTGLGVAWLVRILRGKVALAALIVVIAVSSSVTLQDGEDIWRRAFPPLDDYESVLPRAKELATFTRPDDLVVVIGRGFDPDLLYYARRKGLMITSENASPELYRTLPAQAYRVFFSWDPAHDPLSIMTWWAWNGAVGARTYEIGATPSALRNSAILSTDDASAFDAAARGARALAAAPVTLPCDGSGHQIPADPQGTWLLARGPADGIVYLDLLEGPLPIRRVFALTPLAIHGATAATVSCVGTGSLTLERIIAAPPP